MRRYSSTTKESSRQTLRRERIRIFVIVGVSAVVVFYIVPRLVGGAASLILTPVSHIEDWFFQSGAALPQYLIDRSTLVAENDALTQQLHEAEGDAYAEARLREENEELRALLGDSDESRTAAAVIGRPTATPYDVLVIDKGARDGVARDMPVYVGDEQVIGFVGEVYRDSSIVVMVTTPGVESTAYIYGPNIYTTAEGQGGGVLQVRVPQGIAISEGDLVILPSFQSGVFGRISLVESLPTDPEQRAYVTVGVPLQSVRFVSIGATVMQPVSFEEAKEVVERVRTDITSVPVPSGVLVDVVDDVASSTATSTPDAEVDTPE